MREEDDGCGEVKGTRASILNTKRLMGPSQLPATQQKCYLLFNWKVFYFGMLESYPDIFYICAHSLQTGILRLSPIFNLAKRKTIFDAWTTATQTFPFKNKIDVNPFCIVYHTICVEKCQSTGPLVTLRTKKYVQFLWRIYLMCVWRRGASSERDDGEFKLIIGWFFLRRSETIEKSMHKINTYRRYSRALQQ